MEGEKMIFKAKLLNLMAGKPVIILHDEDAKKYELTASDRVIVRHGKKEAVAFVDTTDNMVKPGEIGLFQDVYKKTKFEDDTKLEVLYLRKPKTLEYIRRKLMHMNYFQMKLMKLLKMS